MRILDLFSCVGCHALGMLRTGHKVVEMCEINPWRRRILMHRFGAIPVHEDVTKFDYPPKVDVVFGGPPCQNTSVGAAISGNRTGATLWPEMLRLGLDACAEWIIVEQPPGNEAWEDKVSCDLSGVGFHVGRLQFSSSDVGAPYLRRRVFLVACSSLQRLAVAWTAIPSAIERVKRAAAARGDWEPDSIPTFGMASWRAEGVDERRERIEALHDSNPPAMAEVIGHMLAVT